MTGDSVTERKIRALLRLLTDPNPQVADTIHRELVNMGSVVLPFFDHVEYDHDLSARFADIREDIRFEKLRQDLKQLLSSRERDLDLEAGTFLLAQSAYPELDVRYYSQQLDTLAEEVRPRLLPSHSLEQASQILAQYLFVEKGFRGNRDHYDDPENSFFNRVLERRTGIPITLSVLYLFLARRLGLTCAGVGMPGHFVVKLEGPEPTVFIDCFNGGVFLEAKNCEQFLIEAGVGFNEAYLRTTPNDLILARMIRNLIGVYEKQQDTGRVDRLNSLMATLDHAPEGG
ncbi:MAG: SirB1 family protein [Nitrospirales bacterium]